MIVALLVTMVWALPGTAAMQVEGDPVSAPAEGGARRGHNADGTKVFVLLKGGEVQVLAPSGGNARAFQRCGRSRAVGGFPGGGPAVPDGRPGVAHGRDRHACKTCRSSTRRAKGPANAPVTLTVFSDFQCPYCSRLVPFIDEVLAKNPDKVRVVFKQFPLRMHNFALPAALASLAAREQGKFWPMHDSSSPTSAS